MSKQLFPRGVIRCLRRIDGHLTLRAGFKLETGGVEVECELFQSPSGAYRIDVRSVKDGTGQWRRIGKFVDDHIRRRILDVVMRAIRSQDAG
jgi:hypothetical protein